MTAAATALGAIAALGVWLLCWGLTPRISPPLSTGLWKTLWARWAAVPSRRRWWIAGALLAGMLVAAWSGFLLAVVFIPALLVGVPFVLGAPPSRELALLAALDRWVRLLATSIGTGKSIRDAIFSTRSQVPVVLQEPVGRLCLRLDQRTPTREALLRFADDLDAADGDAVAAALAIAAARGGIGTRATLDALSATLQDRLRALREVSRERAKPRAVVRQVTTVTLVVILGAVLLNGRFFSPYTTPLGQAIAFALATAYAGCLLVLRARTVPAPAPRFLRGS